MCTAPNQEAESACSPKRQEISSWPGSRCVGVCSAAIYAERAPTAMVGSGVTGISEMQAVNDFSNLSFLKPNLSNYSNYH